MSKSYRLVVFDWEGTLGDTLGIFVEALKTESQRLHLGSLDEVMARAYLMDGLDVAIQRIFPDASSIHHQKLFDNVQQALIVRTNKTFLLPGAIEILQSLYDQGIDLAIASNKSQHSLQRLLINSGIEKLFKIIRTASQVPAKPHPQMLEEIMDFCAVGVDSTLMVGDSVVDIEMANAAKVDAVGVDFYHQESQQKDLIKHGALQVFTNFQQFSTFLNINYVQCTK